MIPFLFILLLLALVWSGLPKLLNILGLHPHFECKSFNLKGKKALIITTSQSRLEPKKKSTGVFPSELTVPYYAFKDAGMDVDLASIKGGQIPFEEYGLRWPVATDSDKRYNKDETAKNAVSNSMKIDDVDISNYDLVFMPGGWGAAYDLGQSDVLGDKITEAWANNAVVGAVCHGPLGLLKARDLNGEPLLKGRKITGVTNKQVKELGVDFTPLHPESALREAGADFQCARAFKDLLADLTVVDGRLVTGQNQNAGKETAQKMMGILANRAVGGSLPQ